MDSPTPSGTWGQGPPGFREPQGKAAWPVCLTGSRQCSLRINLGAWCCLHKTLVSSMAWEGSPLRRARATRVWQQKGSDDLIPCWFLFKIPTREENFVETGSLNALRETSNLGVRIRYIQSHDWWSGLRKRVGEVITYWLLWLVLPLALQKISGVAQCPSLLVFKGLCLPSEPLVELTKFSSCWELCCYFKMLACSDAFVCFRNWFLDTEPSLCSLPHRQKGGLGL